MTTTTLNAATTTTGMGFSSGDDGSLIIKTGATAGAQVNAVSFAADGTPTFLKDSSIGYGQTWQNVTGSRAMGSTYTNSTGKPINVHVVCSNASGGTGYMSLVTGGITFNSASAVTGGYAALALIILPGATYQVPTIAGWSLVQWVELRA